MKTAIAIGAHPDDIEFSMAGTLLMRHRAGWEVHYLNVANGSCGSRRHGPAKMIALRRQEAQAAAQILGAQWHPSLVNDLEVLYALPTLRRLSAVLRVVKLHPLTVAQNARTSGGGNISLVPDRAISVGPLETWLAERVSIWQAGRHDNPFGQRLTAYMISQHLADTAVPMSLLADHPNVQFNYYRGGLDTCEVEMH